MKKTALGKYSFNRDFPVREKEDKIYLEGFYPINDLIKSVEKSAKENNWKAYTQDKMRNVKTLCSGKEWEEYDHTEIRIVGKYELLEKMKIKFKGLSETDSITVRSNISTPEFKVDRFYSNFIKKLKGCI